MILSLAALALSVQAATFESLGSARFRFEPAPLPTPATEPWVPPMQESQAEPLGPAAAPGESLGRLNLSRQLDRHQSLLSVPLGTASWDLGVAGDAAFKKYYLTFSRGAQLRLAPVTDLNRLRNEGVEIEIEPGLVYRFKLEISWLNPVRGSTLVISPSRGTQGPTTSLNSGVLVDAVKAKSYVFSHDGVEYWSLYGTDVDAATGLPGSSRSFLFLRFAGLSSKAWPLSESALPRAQRMRVQLAAPVTMTRGEDLLEIAR